MVIAHGQEQFPIAMDGGNNRWPRKRQILEHTVWVDDANVAFVGKPFWQMGHAKCFVEHQKTVNVGSPHRALDGGHVCLWG